MLKNGRSLFTTRKIGSFLEYKRGKKHHNKKNPSNFSESEIMIKKTMLFSMVDYLRTKFIKKIFWKFRYFYFYC